jgi:hypothetical protein
MWVGLVVLVVVVLFVTILGAMALLWFFTPSGKPPPWRPPQETSFDPSITTPSQTLYLLSFSYQPLLGNPTCCQKMWYAFRYVNQDGRYGNLGPWTTVPVQAGGKIQPCLPPTPTYGPCGKLCRQNDGTSLPCVLTGFDSCYCNLPVIGVPQELDYTVNRGEWSAVIHRQVGEFDGNSQGQPIGMLIGHPNDQRGGLYSWDDVLFSDGLGSGCVC